MLVQIVHKRLRSLGLHWAWTLTFSLWVYLFANSLVHIYLRPHNNPDYVAYLSPIFRIFALSFVAFLAFVKPLKDKDLDFGQSISWVASGVLAILSILTGSAFRLWFILPTFLVLLIYILTKQHKSSQISRYFKINKIPYVYLLNTKAVLHLTPLVIAGYYLYSATYKQNWFYFPFLLFFIPIAVLIAIFQLEKVEHDDNAHD